MSDRLASAAHLLLAERAVRRRVAPPCLPASGTAVWRALEVSDGIQQSLLLESELLKAEERLIGWRERGIELLCPAHEAYPATLRAAEESPSIFVQGRLSDGDGQAVAVIGSRAASRAGVEQTVAVTRELASRRYTILSGLAAGIDAAAHQTAISVGARTIAVIGTGHLHVYPSQHHQLQADLVRRAAVLSPFPPDTAAARWTFPVRNTLMARLAIATVVVEASAFSGTRSAVRGSLAGGRPVFVSPQVAAQPWARELRHHGLVHVFVSAEEIIDRLGETAPTPS